MKYQIIALLIFVFLLGSCGPSPQERSSMTETSAAAFWTATRTPTLTPTITLTPSDTPTSTITPSATITPTPTFSFPVVTVNKQAHCRYGPSIAFLHAGDLYPGDKGTVRGRFEYSSWLYIKPDKLNYSCWVAPSVVDVVGDLSTIRYTEPDLQSVGYNQYGPPRYVQAARDGDQVTISWEQVNMTGDHDRGYLIIAFVCQDGAYLWWTFSYPDQFTTSYTVRDEPGCPVPSEGVIYTVEKHGFSEPAFIPWPPP